MVTAALWADLALLLVIFIARPPVSNTGDRIAGGAVFVALLMTALALLY